MKLLIKDIEIEVDTRDILFFNRNMIVADFLDNDCNVQWFKDKYLIPDSVVIDRFTDIEIVKKEEHWWNNPANFPVRLVRDTEYCTTYRWVYKREEFVKSHRQGFKLVTEDNCTLLRSMF